MHCDTLDLVLRESYDLVVDAIDSFTSKARPGKELIRRNILVISSMGLP